MASLEAQLKGYWQIGKDLSSGSMDREALTATLLEMKKFGLGKMKAAIGGDLSMSEYPRGGRTKPRKAGIGFDVHGRGATFKFRPGGLWRIVEDGAGRHQIGNTRQGSSGQTITRRGQTLLSFGPGQAAYGPVGHPGSPSKGSPMRQTVDKLEPFWFAAFGESVYKRL